MIVLVASALLVRGNVHGLEPNKVLTAIGLFEEEFIDVSTVQEDSKPRRLGT
jgi:hypothetical protein